MNTNKRLKSMLVAVFMLLTFISVNAAPTSSQLPPAALTQSSGGNNDKCYDGVCFEGEVEGNSLMTYENLIKELGITEGQKPSIPREGYEEIYDKNAEEEGKGGIWLKFIDSKYTRDGKPRTYYVMKKPARIGVSWNTLHTAGAIYGWDIIDENTGLPKSNPEKYKNIGRYGTNKDYKAKILTINGEKYIVRLLQGKTNYGGNVTNTKFYEHSDSINSEWNRTILPITQGYRFGSSSDYDGYIEKALRDSDGKSDYSLGSYKVQTANYNWYGDLILSSTDYWKYNGKRYNEIKSYTGQNNWVQELGPEAYERSSRGGMNTSYAAANAYGMRSNFDSISMGVRLVLEPYNPPAPKVEVKQTIKLKKFDPDKKPLAGVKFILNGDTYTTDSKGEVEIPVWKYPAGNLILEEPEQTINGIKYLAKKIPIKREQVTCYDGMCFEGEVEGNSLISYQDIISKTGIGGTTPSISQNVINQYEGAKAINDQYQNELSKGGIYLKFTDNKYKDSNGKPRTFYVSKQPLRKNVSYDMLFNKGLIYGWDNINPDGTIKSNSDIDSTYKPTILTINGKKYIARLLRGRSNYGDPIKKKSGSTDYTANDAPNSEWNRVMLPITQGYRFGSNTNNSNRAEQSLRDSDNNSDYSKRKYKVQIAEYNWFGDLTLGAYYGFYYGNSPKIDNSDNGTGPNGQWNWTQEFSSGSSRSGRGDYSVDNGVASSGYNSSDRARDSYGWRLVLEPLTTNN